MEKIYYASNFTRGCSPNLNFGPSLWFSICWGPLTVKITDRRILITMAGATMFESSLSEISLIKVKPDFLGAKVEVILNNEGGYIFGLNKIEGFFESLKILKVKTEANEESIKSLFKIYNWLLKILLMGLIAFIIFKIISIVQ